jgi:2,3,4,5-tetrahydropyridine-2-carboxylate N-succinyltransferase
MQNKRNTMQNIKSIIDDAYSQISSLKAKNTPEETHEAVESVMESLDCGDIRVAEPNNDGWEVNDWVKKAILLYFKLHQNTLVDGGFTQFFDKIPLKYDHYSLDQFIKEQVRVVPHAIVRKGAHIEPNCVLMPSYINLGAYVGSGTMVDTWATIGSCAQIGKNVHISGGAGIGGVLEPLQATPTIIEDNVFIGARSEIVEGVIVEKGAVISMGVFIGQSTKIYDRENNVLLQGRVPAGSVVVPGSLPSKKGPCHLQCAVIVKTVDEKTRAKVSINELLREVSDYAHG